MPKLTWNKFITKYADSGHVVKTATSSKSFRKPVGISPKNQKKWPNIPDLIFLAEGGLFSGDWSCLSKQEPFFILKSGNRVRAGTLTIYRFVFSDQNDAIRVAKCLKAKSLIAAKSKEAGFATELEAEEINMNDYAIMVAALGYV